jgi:hypothetical protein
MYLCMYVTRKNACTYVCMCACMYVCNHDNRNVLVQSVSFKKKESLQACFLASHNFRPNVTRSAS